MNDDLYIENSITNCLDEVLKAAKSEKYNFAPWIVIPGMTGCGKTASINSWLHYHDLKHVIIDAPALVVHPVEVKYCLADLMTEPSVRMVNSGEMQELFDERRKIINVTLPSETIDSIDENTVVVLENFSFASREQIDELMRYLKAHEVVDLRVDNTEKIRVVNPLMIIVVVETTTLFTNNVFTKEEMKFLGLDGCIW